MAKFRFNLEPVLRQRERAEQAEQASVASIERERLALEDELRGLQRQLEAESQELTAINQGEQFDASQVRAQSAAILRLRAHADQRARALAAVLQRLASARRVLTERAAERRAMELLRDRRLEEFRQDERRREERVADDLFMASRSRRDAAGGLESGEAEL